jgi:hypothetical protein
MPAEGPANSAVTEYAGTAQESTKMVRQDGPTHGILCFDTRSTELNPPARARSSAFGAGTGHPEVAFPARPPRPIEVLQERDRVFPGDLEKLLEVRHRK